MLTLAKADFIILEKYLKDIKQYEKELKYREYEILENHEPENFGASKSTAVSNPIERETIKKFGDDKYNKLDNIVSSVQRLIDYVDEETLEMMKMLYWPDIIEYKLEDVADEFYISRRSLNRRRERWLTKLAEFMKYV